MKKRLSLLAAILLLNGCYYDDPRCIEVADAAYTVMEMRQSGLYSNPSDQMYRMGLDDMTYESMERARNVVRDAWKYEEWAQPKNKEKQAHQFAEKYRKLCMMGSV